MPMKMAKEVPYFYSLLQPGDDGDYEMGNIFNMSPSAGENFKATKAYFSSFRQDAGGNIDLGGETVSIFLYELEEGFRPGVNFNNEPDSEQLNLVGFADYTFPSDYGFNELVEVELTDLETFETGVNIKGGLTYFLVAAYEGSVNNAFHIFDRDQKYRDFEAGISRLIFTFKTEEGWFYGFRDDDRSLPIMRMEIALRDATSTNVELLPESSLVIRPNPVNDLLRTEVILEEASNGMLIIADSKGSVLTSREFSNLKEGNFSFNVRQYPAGNYLLRLSTENGIRTEQFTIAR